MRSLLTDDEKITYFIKFNVDGLLRGGLSEQDEWVCHWKAERLDVCK